MAPGYAGAVKIRRQRWSSARSLLWTLLLQLILLINCCYAARTSERKNEIVCGSMDIRNSVNMLSKLENCTVIEGFLRILLIDKAEPKDFEAMVFPKLREVTDYILLYRASGIKSFGKLFPNLTVIRGNMLFANYALVIFQMVQLQEIALENLREIVSGSVLIRENPNLCYIDTIDWDRIAKNGKGGHFIKSNKPDCVNTCPEKVDCPFAIRNGEKWPLCWNSHMCQSVCSEACEQNNSTCLTSNQCCHDQCLGGCYETGSSSSCISCKNVLVDGTCMKKCPPEMYEYLGRRCVSAAECKNLTEKKEEGLKPFAGKCKKDCPQGYMEDENDKHRCKRCYGQCHKICPGGMIQSASSAQSMKACTIINGSLEIEILGGGSSVQDNLEEGLSGIEEIKGYLQVDRSGPLTSLNFLKNLRIIHGESLDKKEDQYSLIVSNNENLQELWNWQSRKHKLEIRRGKVFFSSNSRLCLKKIKNLNKFANIKDWDDRDVHISPSTNGNKVACVTMGLNITVLHIDAKTVEIRWNNLDDSAGLETLLGYAIYYREAVAQNISEFGHDTCRGDVWTVQDVQVKNKTYESFVIRNLEPYTQYAVYLRTIDSGTYGAQSPLKYFTTLPGSPSPPVDLQVRSTSHSDILIQWNPPRKPNGNITHYIVTGRWERDSPEFYETRNYCVKPIRFDRSESIENILSATTTPSPEPQDGKQELCCSCTEDKQISEEHASEAQFNIRFENYLHDLVFISMDGSDSKMQEITTSSDDVNSTSESATSQLFNVMPNDTFRRIISQTFLPVQKLRHFSQYFIEVIACREDGPEKFNCSASAVTAVRTHPLGGADDIDINSFKIITENVTHRAIFVKWEEPKQPNGLIVSYQIEYRRVNVEGYKPASVCISRDLYRQYKGFALKNLLPGNYSIQIRTTSLAGIGNWTQAKYFEVLDIKEGFPTLAIAIGVTLAVSVIIGILGFLYYQYRTKTPKYPVYWTSNPDYMSASDYNLDNWEISPDHVEFLKELGHGAFGKVYEGKWNVPNGESIKCAIKTVNESATGSVRTEFLREASVMTSFDCYHVVKLLGVVTKSPVPYVLMELMEVGDLKSFLLSHRPDDENLENIQPPPAKLLCEMAIDIADGMAYLAQNKFVHRDLAARNCMVAADYTVKIGDFGMTRDTYMCDYYRRGDHCRQPVRWMAPESLRDGVFTSQSDVWSYGVVLWEIATLACQPYQGFSNEQVCKYVINGGIMEKPENCSELFYDMMKSCWKQNPKARPTFIELIETLLPDCNPRFREVSFYFTRLTPAQDDQEQIDVDTPLTPLRSPATESAYAEERGDSDDGEERQYLPTSAIFNERLLMIDMSQQDCCEDLECDGRTCRGACGGRESDGDTSRGLSIRSNEGSKGMSVPSSSEGSKGSASSGSLANGRINFANNRTSAC